MPTDTTSLRPTTTEVDVLAALTAMQAQIEHLLGAVQQHRRELDRIHNESRR